MHKVLVFLMVIARQLAGGVAERGWVHALHALWYGALGLGFSEAGGMRALPRLWLWLLVG
jgi:hypothetical protein